MTDDHLEALTRPRTVGADRIGDSLREMWSQADAESTEDAGQAMVRACGLTVIALAASDDDLNRTCVQVGIATAAVPARTLIVQTDASVDGGLSAEVSAFCALGAGGRQVCQEQVLLKCAADRVADLPSLITPLPVPDLPVVLFLATPDLLEGELVDRLLPAIDLLVLDSSGALELARTFHRLVRIHDRRGIGLRDLAFERLLTWREAIASAFDQAGPDGRLSRVEVVGTGGDSEAQLLLGWVASRFDGEQAPEIRMRRPAGDQQGQGRSLRLDFRGGAEIDRCLLQQSGQHVIQQEESGSKTACSLPRPMRPDDELLIRILSDPQGDRIYDQALRAAIHRLEGR